jgi:hypothetical protein
MVTEKSVYILGVQKLLVLSTFLVGTSKALPYSAAAMVAQSSSTSKSGDDSITAVQDVNVTALQQLLVEGQNQMIWPDQHVRPLAPLAPLGVWV